MRDWIVIVVLYVFAACFLRLLGGFAAAADAFRSWGRASSTIRNQGSPSA